MSFRSYLGPELHRAALQQSPVLAAESGGPAERKAHRVYAARRVAVGHSPSVASIYRALAQHEKAQADFAALRQRSATALTSSQRSRY
ncbi:hypothetical protein [Streptomyces sp. AB3(2024)]|uniref:hypothetical protein n=1 Tax=Streptomyces sp. AB3(2024) TaxID=3317321 RepID=UPI0035A28955